MASSEHSFDILDEHTTGGTDGPSFGSNDRPNGIIGSSRPPSSLVVQEFAINERLQVADPPSPAHNTTPGLMTTDDNDKEVNYQHPTSLGLTPNITDTTASPPSIRQDESSNAPIDQYAADDDDRQEAHPTNLVEAENAPDVEAVVEAVINQRFSQMPVVGVASTDGNNSIRPEERRKNIRNMIVALALFLGLLAIAGAVVLTNNNGDGTNGNGTLIAPTITTGSNQPSPAPDEESSSPTITSATGDAGKGNGRVSLEPSSQSPAPTESPSKTPSTNPTTAGPSKAPSTNPTTPPVPGPNEGTTPNPTLSPTTTPTSGPTIDPTIAPVPTPTLSPTAPPTSGPTIAPVSNRTPSPVTAKLRADNVRDVLADLAPWDPQALDWISDTDTWQPEEGDPNSDYLWRERYVMAVLYFTTNGANWGNNTNWLSTEPVCNWYFGGTTTNACPEPIRDLMLQGNQLTSSIPASIGSLVQLTSMNFGENQLTSSIPTSIGSLTNLIFLSLYNNRLTSSIPASIGSLTQLTLLSFVKNRLTSTIPASIGSMTKLELLYLSDNDISGTIPFLPTSIGFLNCQMSNNCFQDFGYGQRCWIVCNCC